MRTLVFTLLLCTSLYSQEKAVVHINAEFNKSNDWYGIESLDGVKVYNGYIDSNPAIKEKYNIKKVPTLILFVNGKEAQRWEASLDMKLHATTKEIQNKIDSY
jgi:hypothetical protein